MNIYLNRTVINSTFDNLKNLIMVTKDKKQKKARFDTRLPEEQKMLFERAAQLGGYRNLTDFIVMTVQEKAQEIITKREQVIASEKDSEIFFNAINNPPKANKNLIEAVKEYKALTSE